MSFGDPLFPGVADLCSGNAGTWTGGAVFLAVSAALTMAVTETRAGWFLRRRVWNCTVFTCARCLGFWVGVALALLLWGPARDAMGPVGAMLDGLLSSFMCAVLAPAAQRLHSTSAAERPDDGGGASPGNG